MKKIDLQGGSEYSHQNFSAQLGDNLIDFNLNYIQTGQWCLNLEQNGVLIANGLMLEPNAELTQHLNLNIGKLFFIGEQPTLDNLGIKNSLIWVEDA